MIMALELVICGSLVTIGGCLWYLVERRTERLVAREKRETERWRQAYTELCSSHAAPHSEGLAPLPLQLDDDDQHNLNTFGRTVRKRIHLQKAGGA